jgi:thioredoxin reductase (NADPH)
VSGADLAQRAYQQAWVFGTRFLLMRRATALRQENARFTVAVGAAGEVRARAVVLATGVSYTRIGIPSLEALTGAGVFYGASAAEAQGVMGEHVVLVGGGNSAGQAATHLSRYAGLVTILVREGSLAENMSAYLRKEIANAGNIDVRYHTEVTDGGGEGMLTWLSLRDNAAGTITRTSAAALFILIGARPRTAWLPPSVERDERGFIKTGPDITSGSERVAHIFETSLSGVFAVGDVRHGSVKRVASAVGEGSVVIQELHRYLTDTRLPATAPAAAVR